MPAPGPEASKDPIEAQMRSWHVAQYLDHSTDFDSMDKIEALPPCVCLKADAIEEPFTEGDCIVSIEDQPAYSLHNLRLYLDQSEQSGSVSLSVRNSAGETRTLELLLD